MKAAHFIAVAVIAIASTTEAYQVQALCSDCEIRNGVGYRGHPDDCNKYTQCYPAGQGVWRAVVRSCPAGLFWDQSKLTCNRPGAVACAQDRCAVEGKTRWPYANSCRGFWICRDGRTDGFGWCGPFQSYNDDTDDCEDDRSCVDDDDEDKPIVPTPCSLEEHETDDLQFYQYVWGRRVARDCAPGTAFSWDKCGCGTILPGVGAGCRTGLYLPLDEDFRDVAGGNWVDNTGCRTRAVAGAVGGKAAYFDGSCQLIVPRFSNHDFRETVVIQLRYKEDDDGRPSRLQSLVSNGDCSKVPSIAIAYDKKGQSTKGILRTGTQGQYDTLNVQKAGVWKKVEYEYDGDSFILRTNGNSDGTVARAIFPHPRVTDLGGNVRVVHSALHIGDGAGMARFRGYIDELKVYLCKP